MSSATSIKRDFRLKAEATSKAEATGPDGRGAQNAEPRDSGFRPWHFFVLASLAASTAAVLLSRRSSPEHLVLLSITIGAAGLAAAAFYRMLAPFALHDVSQLSDPPSERALAALEREKALVLRSIKELEFDRAMGKVGDADFAEMSSRLRARALSLMQDLERSDVRAPAAPGRLNVRLECPACRTTNEPDAKFCKHCGERLGP